MPAIVKTSENHVNCDMDDEVVITGISARLPESESMEEFKQNLYDNIDMVTDDPRRFKSGIFGLPKRAGKLKNLTHFDAAFFGVHPKQADMMDPQLRMLLELTYEATVDAGMNPAELRGTRTGVYIGASESESIEYWNEDAERVNGYGLTGCSRAMFANRLSYSFDLKGPSYAIDTACSSSLYALNQAFNDIKKGVCDSAIVGGVNLLLRPTISLQFYRLGMLSDDGKCKAFDSDPRGYVRAEAAVVILLQKSSVARREYCTILGVKSNTDGAKDEGITYPSGEMQRQLIKEVYAESEIDPADIVYLEAHGTGTKVGDPQEINSLTEVFCTKNRKTPLLIGSVKSNMGHSEPASGMCSIAKLVLAMNSGVIPANLHFSKPNENIPALHDGRLKVVDKNMTWNGGLIGLNSFGFGGANTHVIIRSNPRNKQIQKNLIESIPRLILTSGRTESAVDTLINKIGSQAPDPELYALVNKIHVKNIQGHSYRGYGILDEEIEREIKEILPSQSNRPVWFVLSGMGAQWPLMAKELYRIDTFKRTMQNLHKILAQYNYNLENILFDESDTVYETILNSFVCNAAVQIALVDVLRSMGIEPDGIVGHSSGEVICAYADGVFNTEQAILAAYVRGKAIQDTTLPKGAMAAVNLTWEQCKELAPEGVIPVCHNSEDNCTVSGPPAEIDQFIAKLTGQNLFAKKVKSSNYAFHSKYIADAGPKLKEYLDKIITAPKKRSSRWVSSSIPESKWDLPLAQYNSAEYHVNNLLSPVLFHEALLHVPKDAIVIEIAAHTLLQAVIKNTLGPDITYIGLSKRGHSDNVKFFLSNIGKLYNAGVQPNVAALYKPVAFPVSKGTPMINSMVEWDHRIEWIVADFSEMDSARELSIEVDINKDDFSFITGHTIDGRVLFPATGYLVLVWQTFAKVLKNDHNQMPIIMEDVKFTRATIMPKEGSVKFIINIFGASGEFEVVESGTVVTSGRIYTPEDVNRELSKLHMAPKRQALDALPLNAKDIYKELHLRGYEYKAQFQGVMESDNYGTIGKLKWDNNWITFMDTMLQFTILGSNTRDLMLPTAVQKVIIDPESHLRDGNEDFVVQYNNVTSIIKSGYVELRGVKVSLAPKKQQNPSSLVMEKYKFIPYINENNDKVSQTDILNIIGRIVLENIQGAMKVKTSEILNASPDMLLMPQLKDVFDSEPLFHSDAMVISPNQLANTELTEKAINLTIKDIQSATIDQNTHLLILSNCMPHKESLNGIMTDLKPNRFVLVHENESSKLNSDYFKTMGLEIVYSQKSDNRQYILLRKVPDLSNRTKFVVDITNGLGWLETLKKYLKDSEGTDNIIYVISQCQETSGIVGFINCLRLEAGGNNVRSVFIADKNAEKFSIKSEFYMKQLRKDLIHNVLKNSVWGSYKHLPLQETANNKLSVEHAYINTLVRGDLSSLNWIENSLSFHKDDPTVKMCNVYCAPLNFRDVMIATGKISPDNVGGKSGNADCVLGLEFAGKDLDGNRIMGIVSSQSLATTVLADPDFMWKIPDKWSMEEAATVPVVYATCYFALMIRGRLQPGETVLIHAGTGGIGISAITIALSMGCKVFTTVGSEEKRAFLKKRFPQLTDDCIGNSRNSSFEQLILKETNGRGVDIILNSLAADLLHASVRCLAIGGRFLEIGKVDIINNNDLKMGIFIKNTSFHGVHLDGIFDHPVFKKEIFKLVTDGIQKGVVKPLPFTVFEDDRVEEAFRFMATGKHIGKVLLKIRDDKKDTKMQTMKRVEAIPRTYMDPSKIYILVGGLGGFGLELAHWLISRGAKHICLTSRQGIRTGYQSSCVRRWRENGINILISTVDVTTSTGAKLLLEECKKAAPIGGIFNLAAVLKDALFENLTEADFITSFKPKVDGTINLDAQSRIHAPNLDYFVTFSSVSCGRGNMGQSNYGFSNSVMERICEMRTSVGLPGLAIQWGAIGDVGLILETMGGNDTEVGGTLPQRIYSCMNCMDLFLQQPNPVVASMVLVEKKGATHGQSKHSPLETVANILGIKNPAQVSQTVSLADLGMDSLMATEIKQTLERNHDIILSPQEIRSLTIEKLNALSSDYKFSNDAKENSTDEDSLKDLMTFDNELMPKETLVTMNEANSKHPIFAIHAIQGTITCLMGITKGANATCYGLQCTANAPLKSIKDLAAYYLKYIRSKQKSGPYFIIGYSFGACVAFEIGLQLEKENETVKLLLIDGSHSYVAVHTGQAKQDKITAGDTTKEQSEAMAFFIQQFREINQPEVLSELLKMKSIDERLSRTSELISPIVSVTKEEIAQAAYSFYCKLIAGDQYKPDSMLKGDVTLIKASETLINHDEDYGLKTVCKNKVNIHTVKGNHRTILNTPELKEIVKTFH